MLISPQKKQHVTHKGNNMIINVKPFQQYEPQKSDWIEYARKAYKADVAIKQLQKEYKELMDQLKLMADYKAAKGGGYYLTRIESKGAVQYKDIPELQGLDLEPYRGSLKVSWKIERK